MKRVLRRANLLAHVALAGIPSLADLLADGVVAGLELVEDEGVELADLDLALGFFRLSRYFPSMGAARNTMPGFVPSWRETGRRSDRTTL